jgi:hypothetical protein
MVSIRVPAVLAQEVREAARKRRTSVSAFLTCILDIALLDGPDLSRLPDAREHLDDKIDLRLSEELFHQLQPVCKRLGMSVSVYV